MRHKVDFESMDWETSAVGLRMKVHREGATQIRLVEFSKGYMEPDWCARGHIGYLLEGRMEIDFNGSREIFEPGDGLFIPSGPEHKHKAKILTDVARVILLEEARVPEHPTD